MLTAWLTGITGVIALGVLLEILLPEGQTGKYVKGAFSLLVILVIVSPLPTVFGALKEWQPDYSDIAPDDAFLDETRESFALACGERAEGVLADEGYESEVYITITEGSMSEFDEIAVILSVGSISAEEENRVLAEAARIVAEALGADPGVVSVTVKEVG